jgi:hypothetical protein
VAFPRLRLEFDSPYSHSSRYAVFSSHPRQISVTSQYLPEWEGVLGKCACDKRFALSPDVFSQNPFPYEFSRKYAAGWLIPFATRLSVAFQETFTGTFTEVFDDLENQ